MPAISKRKIERAVRELTPLSEAAQALVALRNDPNHSRADIVSVVERDAALTIRLLRIANSPVIAPVSPIESLHQAVSLMGEDVVVTAALSIGANWMRESLSGYGPDAKIFENGLTTAIAAALIAKRGGKSELASLAYTGGLLHDIGKAVVSEFLESGCFECDRRSRDGPRSGLAGCRERGTGCGSLRSRWPGCGSFQPGAGAAIGDRASPYSI